MPRILQPRVVLEAFARFLPRIQDLSTEDFFAEYHARLNEVEGAAAAVPWQRRELIDYFQTISEPYLDVGLMHPRARRKPLGYAGDYLLLDWIHTGRVDSTSDIGQRWDRFFHLQAAPRAVRNRKALFGQVFAKLCWDAGRGISVLDLASGSCRDVAEAITGAGSTAAGARILCIDQEPQAAEYARGIALHIAQRAGVGIEWRTESVIGTQIGSTFDLVWAAGLFDYLKDGVATVLLRRMWRWTAPGGRLIIGNFHPHNPTRSAQEWCLDWQLIHRTEDDLARLLAATGIPRADMAFETEPLGTIVFAVAQRTSEPAD